MQETQSNPKPESVSSARAAGYVALEAMRENLAANPDFPGELFWEDGELCWTYDSEGWDFAEEYEERQEAFREARDMIRPLLPTGFVVGEESHWEEEVSFQIKGAT